VETVGGNQESGFRGFYHEVIEGHEGKKKGISIFVLSFMPFNYFMVNTYLYRFGLMPFVGL